MGKWTQRHGRQMEKPASKQLRHRSATCRRMTQIAQFTWMARIQQINNHRHSSTLLRPATVGAGEDVADQVLTPASPAAKPGQGHPGHSVPGATGINYDKDHQNGPISDSGFRSSCPPRGARLGI